MNSSDVQCMIIISFSRIIDDLRKKYNLPYDHPLIEAVQDACTDILSHKTDTRIIN